MPCLFLRKGFALFAVLFLGPALLFAFQTELSSEAVRDAYFLGQRHDQKLANFLSSYEQHFALPKTGPYISSIQVFTPYAQIVEASRENPDYSAQQAELDYRQRGDTIKISVRIEFTPTYTAFETVPAGPRSGGQTATRPRSQDFWKDFRFGLSQDDNWLEPLEVYGEPIYTRNDAGSGALSGALVWLVYDAKDVRSEPVLVEVVTPGDLQKVDAQFDLEQLP